MIISLVVVFIIGLSVGMFLGVVGLSLCLIGKFSDARIESEA